MKPCKPLQTDTPNFLLVQKPCQGLISCETDRGCSAPSDRIEDAYTSDRSWTVEFLIQSRNWARSQSAILVRPSACMAPVGTHRMSFGPMVSWIDRTVSPTLFLGSHLDSKNKAGGRLSHLALKRGFGLENGFGPVKT